MMNTFKKLLVVLLISGSLVACSAGVGVGPNGAGGAGVGVGVGVY